MELLLGLSVTTWIIGAVIAVVLFYWYKSSVNNHYWKDKNVTSETPGVSLRTVFTVLTGKLKPIFLIDLEKYQKYGRICGIYFFGRTPMLMVAEPELLKMIFVKDFHNFPERRTIPTNDILGKMVSNMTGDEWKRMRTIITPVFTSGKMRKLAHLINKSAETLTECFMESADNKKPEELKRLFGGFTLDVIASTAFGTELDSIRHPDNIFGTNARKLFTITINWRLLMFAVAPKLMFKLGISIFHPGSIKFFTELVEKIREQRANGGEVREDFLQMLLDIETTTTEEIKDDHSENHYGTEGGDKLPSEQGQHIRKSLTRDELVAQCVMFFLAGYDTTGTTLTLVTYCLALNPECQDRLLKEVDETWEKHEGKMDFDIVSSMKYLEAVVAEGLRLYPPGARVERKCMEDYVLGDTGITVPKDMIIGVPIYAMHRDAEFFPEPEEFRPERFLPENKDSIIPYTYLPFGSGPRNCIAMRFALMEVKLCLVHVLRHVSFHRCPETKVPPDYYNGSGLIQPRELMVRVERRR